MKSFFCFIKAAICFHCTIQCEAHLFGNENLGIASYRHDYDNADTQVKLECDKASEFLIHRYQSPESIKSAFDHIRKRSSFKWFNGKDRRKGWVSCTKLGGDWVLAESEQVCPDCTTEDVLKAYLDGDLQQKWNAKEVLECRFICKDASYDDHPIRISQISGKYYIQNLWLQSQRVITSQTGIMRYSQTITIDKIGDQDYTVLVKLDPHQRGATVKRPFNDLSVYVSLQQRGNDVGIYAAGVMEVNRKVVPNLIVFDASGIAGSMAGKGTLWLSAYFSGLKKASH